jgi:hypothetical protein
MGLPAVYLLKTPGKILPGKTAWFGRLMVAGLLFYVCNPAGQLTYPALHKIKTAAVPDCQGQTQAAGQGCKAEKKNCKNCLYLHFQYSLKQQAPGLFIKMSVFR